MENTEKTKDQTNPEVEIVIKKHQQLFDLLNDPRRMWRVLLSLFFIIVVLFVGIALVVMLIKKYYPYNVIETNIQGASIMKNEDKEVIYWLFNTADLWANSGIKVEEGNILTIRASGASFTAIHHLVESAKENYKPNDQWVGSEGQKKTTLRDQLRAEYRINKYCDEGILLMQIIPEDSLKDKDWKEKHPNLLTHGYIEIIGKERVNLRISKTGILHFAVNDIVLSDSILNTMYAQFVNSFKEEYFVSQDGIQNFKTELFEAFKALKDDPTKLERIQQLNDNIKKESDIIKSIERDGLSCGRYPRLSSDTMSYRCYPLVNELVYYKQKSFRDAWYIDNLGSFLVVIERQK